MGRPIKFRKKGAYKGIHVNAGYFYIYFPTHPNAHSAKKLYFPLHRLIMEWKLGRRILNTEIVHHKDGDTFNNHPDNLEIMSVSEHNRHTALNRKRKKDGKF
jgi:hypothetical protein